MPQFVDTDQIGSIWQTQQYSAVWKDTYVYVNDLRPFVKQLVALGFKNTKYTKFYFELFSERFIGVLDIKVRYMYVHCICFQMILIFLTNFPIRSPNLNWEYIQYTSLSSCNNIKAFDFSNLYTTIPHSKLKDKLRELIQLCFIKKNGQRNKSARRRAQFVPISMPTVKDNKYIVNQKLDHLDDISFWERFGRIRVFLFTK
jgi:hypothetical protein